MQVQVDKSCLLFFLFIYIMHYNRESYKFMSYIWRESYSELKFIFF